jgi:hypothetical protein
VKDRRSSYRVEQRASGLRATFEMKGEVWEGGVADTSVGGVAVSYALASAPALALGDCIDLSFVGGGIKETRQTRVWVRSSVDTGIHRRIGFSFSDPSKGPDGVAVQSVEGFNRRAWIRVVPDRRISAVVVPLEGSHKGVEIEVGVADLSAGGIAVLVTGVSPERLRDVSSVTCRITFPGEVRSRTIQGQVRGREHLTQYLRLGISFDRAEGSSTPNYERSWDCGHCGRVQLLAATHLHCPACSHPRGDADSYLLRWSLIAPLSAHPYSGDDQACLVCTACYSMVASFCGRCGAALSQRG